MFCLVVSLELISFPDYEMIPTTPFFVYIERKAWVYGKSLQLKWGEMCVRPCEDKWVFIFEVIPDVG